MKAAIYELVASIGFGVAGYTRYIFFKMTYEALASNQTHNQPHNIYIYGVASSSSFSSMTL
jgi:hypothetical protein